MSVTLRRLNRATLSRQLLLEREQLSVVDALGRIMALQAQEPPSPYLALWNRLDGFDPADLDIAFSNHEVVKATLMRITLHVVAAGDYPMAHVAMQGTLRDSRLNDRRFRSTGLTVEQADALVPHVLAYLAEPRRNGDVDEMIADHLRVPADQYIWWALRTYAPVWRFPSRDTWSFGRYPEYTAARTDGAVLERTAAIGELFRRYLAAFGPASRRDFGQFALLRQSEIRPAVDAQSEMLVTLEGPDGEELFDLPDAGIPDGDTPAPPRLMAMWDSVLFAYQDRSRVIPAEYRKAIIRNNGDSLPTLLVDGKVAGVWRPVGGRIEATAFQRLSATDWDGLEKEATALVALLAEREPNIYSRYSNWWSKLPGGEVRLLG